MIGLNHAIIIIAGMTGLLLGGVLIDLDHSGSWNTKWKEFWGIKTTEDAHKGLLHNHVVMLSLVSFFICLGFGILLHYIADYVGAYH